VRPLERKDLELVLAWRSHPAIYEYAREQDGPLEWADHLAWFEDRSPDRFDFVIHVDCRRVGVVSLGVDDEVSIYLGDASARGSGVATASLEWLCSRFDDRTPLHAEIHAENEPSQRLFERAGFEEVEREGGWLVYRYDS
jgi:RimJ/RimL family protein N-acetyltransferase